MAGNNVTVLTERNFGTEVLNNDKLSLVDFWAPWCGPCQAVGPIVEELAEEYKEKLNVGKVNVDENRELAMQYGIVSIPTLIFFRDGKVADTVIGAVPKQMLEDKILSLLS